MMTFQRSQPIFVQIRQRIAEMILSGTAEEGEALPSVRTDRRRSLGQSADRHQGLSRRWSISASSKAAAAWACSSKPGRATELLAHEREKFLTEDWPRIVAQIKALDLDPTNPPCKETEGPSHE